jgi:hypothetical protein
MKVEMKCLITVWKAEAHQAKKEEQAQDNLEAMTLHKECQKLMLDKAKEPQVAQIPVITSSWNLISNCQRDKELDNRTVNPLMLTLQIIIFLEILTTIRTNNNS